MSAFSVECNLEPEAKALVVRWFHPDNPLFSPSIDDPFCFLRSFPTVHRLFSAFRSMRKNSSDEPLLRCDTHHFFIFFHFPVDLTVPPPWTLGSQEGDSPQSYLDASLSPSSFLAGPFLIRFFGFRAIFTHSGALKKVHFFLPVRSPMSPI